MTRTPALPAPTTRTVLRHAGTVAVGLVVLGGAAACSTVDVGPRTTQEREVGEVASVRLETSGRLVVQRGPEPSLAVSAGELVVDRLTSEVVDGTLVLGVQDRGPGVLGPVEYRLTVGELTEVDVRGSGDVEGHGVTGRDVAVRIGGSGDVDLSDLDTDTVRVVLEGSGAVRLAGAAREAAIAVEGSGEVLADDLEAEEADVTVRGSGEVEVHVTGDLRAVVDGSGSVRHTGDPDVVADVRGSGEVSGR